MGYRLRKIEFLLNNFSQFLPRTSLFIPRLNENKSKLNVHDGIKSSTCQIWLIPKYLK